MSDPTKQFVDNLRARALESFMLGAAEDLLVSHVFTSTYTSVETMKPSPSYRDKMDRKFNRFLYRLGRYLQKTAQNSIRPRNKGRGKAQKVRYGQFGLPSQPYTPVRIPGYQNKSPLKELISFAFEPATPLKPQRLVAGPQKFRPSPKLLAMPRGNVTIAAVMEHGGNQVWRTSGQSITNEPRPTMGLALTKALKAKVFQNLLQQVS